MMFKISQQILSLPFFFDEVDIVVGLLLVSDVLQACSFFLLLHLIFDPDVLLLFFTIKSHFGQFVFISGLFLSCLSLKSLNS